MRKFNIASLFFFILFIGYSNSSFANSPLFSDPHDSLSFDGSGDGTVEKKKITEDECTFKIEVTGTVTAMVRTKVPGGCEDSDDAYLWQRREAKTGDIVKAGEEIVTGSDGQAKVFLEDGSVFLLDKNSKMTPDINICSEVQRNTRLDLGRIWTKIKKAIGGGKFEVSTHAMAVGVRGTEFAIETDGSANVLKVYEGSVEVKPTVVIDKIEGKAEKLEQLAKDFEEGKITMEEFSQKMTEISSEVQKDSEQLNIIVEAGYQLTVGKDGTITGPDPIGSDDEKWWLN